MLTVPGLDGAPAIDNDHVWSLTFEHSPVGMALVQLDGSWHRVNQSLCAMLGFSAERLMGMTFQDITHPDDLAPDLHLVDECLAGVRDGYRMTKRYLHADGHLVWGDLSVALVRDDGGRPIYFISQILDVSQHRDDQERLRQALNRLTLANSDLEHFAAIISHDLKTPLAALTLTLGLVSDHLTPDEDGEPQPVDDPTSPMALARIMALRAEAAAGRMNALIDALLAYTTTDPHAARQADWAHSAVPTRLGDVVTTALADVHVQAESASARVTTGVSVEQAEPVLISAALVRTLLVNLVSNAVKYRDPARPLGIWIEVEPTQGIGGASQLTVCVRNDGPAILPADRERVFSFLARGERAGPGDQPVDVSGFGIGLAACRRIADWHGGRIWIDEPAEGGVAVRFTLPLAVPASVRTA